MRRARRRGGSRTHRNRCEVRMRRNHISILADFVVNLILLISFRTAHIFSDKAFMFSLKNADGKAYKMAVRQGYEKWAVYSKSGYGPSFGDLVIRNNCHTNTNSYAQPGDDFELPAGYTHDTNQSRSLLAGSLHFKCDEYEVFYQE